MKSPRSRRKWEMTLHGLPPHYWSNLECLSATISVYGELLQPSVQLVESLTEDELAKQKCLLFTAKNLNQIKSIEVTKAGIKEHIGTELVTLVYFPRARGVTHNGTANVECLHTVVYKQYVRKSARILGKYVTFHLHPRSLMDHLRLTKLR